MCKSGCSCVMQKCEPVVKNCFADETCVKAFGCAVSKCECGGVDMHDCVKGCADSVGATLQNTTKEAVECFKSKCPEAPMSPTPTTSSVQDPCAEAKCKSGCSCVMQKCEPIVKNCLADETCMTVFGCAVGNCECGDGMHDCVKDCADLVGATNHNTTQEAVTCFINKCPEAMIQADEAASLEWKVVFDEKVNVREKASTEAPVIGSKMPGDFIKGRDLGDWVEVVGERGYVIKVSPAKGMPILRAKASEAEKEEEQPYLMKGHDP